MPTIRDRGIVLRVKTIRDADRHYIIYTERNGKIALLAKGARKGKSKMSPHMASFGVVDLMIARGKMIDRLAGASLARAYPGVAASLDRAAAAQSALLAIDALTKHDLPEERVFYLILELYETLNAAPARAGSSRSLPFDAAMFKLLDILGFGLELDACIRCRRPIDRPGTTMAILRGGTECMDCRDPVAMRISSQALAALRHFRTSSLNVVSATPIADLVAREAGFVVELALLAHVDARFPALKYLKTMLAY